jgi:hypothetical protein
MAFALGCGHSDSNHRAKERESVTGEVSVAPGISYSLEDGEQYNREASSSFAIPAHEKRVTLKPGQIVKLMFRITTDNDMTVERMWVIVTRSEGDWYTGKLDNQPVSTDKIEPDMPVRFQARHVIAIYEEPIKP